MKIKINGKEIIEKTKSENTIIIAQFVLHAAFAVVVLALLIKLFNNLIWIFML